MKPKGKTKNMDINGIIRWEKKQRGSITYTRDVLYKVHYISKKIIKSECLN